MCTYFKTSSAYYRSVQNRFGTIQSVKNKFGKNRSIENKSNKKQSVENKFGKKTVGPKQLLAGRTQVRYENRFGNNRIRYNKNGQNRLSMNTSSVTRRFGKCKDGRKWFRSRSKFGNGRYAVTCIRSETNTVSVDTGRIKQVSNQIYNPRYMSNKMNNHLNVCTLICALCIVLILSTIIYSIYAHVLGYFRAQTPMTYRILEEVSKKSKKFNIYTRSFEMIHAILRCIDQNNDHYIYRA